MKKDLRLIYKEEAPNSLEGWEKYSLPIGNGRFGASIFGGLCPERVQITTNEFANDYSRGGVGNFMEIHLDFATSEANDYERGLRLQDGVAYSSFEENGKAIKRECFYSYPDKALVYHISSSGPISFKAKLVIPYLGARSVEDGGRTGKVGFEDGYLTARGSLPFRSLLFDARLDVRSDGKVKRESDSFVIDGAKETTLIFVASTSYRLVKETFYDEKALGEDPKEEVIGMMKAASALSYEELYQRHKDDYSSLMGRVDFHLSDEIDKRSVPELLEAYRKGENVPYLEELYFFFGRHLLISSSRKGGLPASLQGVWTAHDKSPWGSGFWHNINIQMNYWPAFSTNLAETFDAYIDFFEAYLPKASDNAAKWIEDNFEKKPAKGAWIIGTGAFAYQVEGMSQNTHSGPGTGGMTAQLFMDAYEFTQDEKLLEGAAYKAIHGLAAFLVSCVKDYDGKYLCSYSASPEQILSGHWENDAKEQQYYHTIGCAFDEQWLEQNARNDLAIASILGKKDEVTEEERLQIGHYSPVEIGYSGQIKEYGEEHFYGEIGEYCHRHISELVGLMPGNIITNETPAWLDAAKVTLEYRGDKSTGWALAHRLCAWARAKDGEHAYKLLQTMLREKTHPNLWDVHPPFQIDGNFGALAGMAEMLLQSHEGYISILPALPKKWGNASFKGLKARGNFEVSLSLIDGRIDTLSVVSLSGKDLKVYFPGFVLETKVFDGDEEIAHSFDSSTISFKTTKGHTYRFSNIMKAREKRIPEAFIASYCADGVHLSWKSGTPVALFRAIDDDEHYQEIGRFGKEGTFVDETFSSSKRGRATYKLVDASYEYSERDIGKLAFISPASKLEEDRYRMKLKVNNLTAEKIGWDF